VPIYDYICGSCGERTEVMHGVHASGPEACPVCGGGPMRKALHPPAIHFKGTGWAKKERAASGPKAVKDAGTSSGAKPSPGSDAAPTPGASPPGEAGAPKDAAPSASTVKASEG